MFTTMRSLAVFAVAIAIVGSAIAIDSTYDASACPILVNNKPVKKSVSTATTTYTAPRSVNNNSGNPQVLNH